MSFILDALKKAEAERQRQTGPTLLEVRVSASRRRFPVWLLVIGGLLGINMVLLLVFLLHRPAPEAAPAVTAAPAAPVVAPSPVPPAAQAPTLAPTAPMTATVPPGYAAAPGAVPYGPAGYAQSPYPQQPYLQQPYPAPPYAQAYPAQPPAGQASATDPGADNPADYEPAIPPAMAARTRSGGSVSPSEPKPEPPSLSQIDGNMPELRLDMHVYASRPADRYALINMHRVREGDTLPEGPRVVSIDRDGVELSYRGTEFMLHPQ